MLAPPHQRSILIFYADRLVRCRAPAAFKHDAGVAIGDYDVNAATNITGFSVNVTKARRDGRSIYSITPRDYSIANKYSCVLAGASTTSR